MWSTYDGGVAEGKGNTDAVGDASQQEGSCMSSIYQSLDADDVLGYTSVRRVKIRDRRLGLMFLFFVCGILAYVGGYNVYSKQLYRKQGDLLGSVHLELDAIDPSLATTNPANTSFCGTGPGIPYDGPASGGVVSIPFQRYNCSYLDPYDAVWPSAEVAAMFISSRITRQNYTLPSTVPGCTVDQLSPQCAYIPQGPNTTVYIADVEMSTIQLEHLFTVPQLGISRASVQMKGSIKDENGVQLDPCDDYLSRGISPCPANIGVGMLGRPDQIPLATLLRAAGIPSLDVAAGTTSPLNTQTLRYSGFVLVVTITYSNYRVDTASMLESEIVYTIGVDSVADLAFRGSEVLPEPGAGSVQRTILERHGIRILVHQSGTVGTFDAATLLVTANTILGLLAVAKAVVDFISTRCLPARHIYRQYMTIHTADFSDLDSLPKEDLSRFQHEDLVNVHPSVFGRVDKDGHIHMDVSREPGTLRMENSYPETAAIPRTLDVPFIRGSSGGGSAIAPPTATLSSINDSVGISIPNEAANSTSSKPLLSKRK